MTDKPRGIMERLSDVSACYPGCEGRCVECPDDVTRDAKAEILALRQRAEAAEARVAELQAALRPIGDATAAAVAYAGVGIDSNYFRYRIKAIPVEQWRSIAAALAKGGAG